MTVHHLPMSDRDIQRAAMELQTGRHGGFAESIAIAYHRADPANRARLVEAFPELFKKGRHFWELWNPERA